MNVGGRQVYKATAFYTGTAAAWAAGLAVKDGRSVNFDLMQTEIGAYASSFIAGTRASDQVPIDATGFSPAHGTFLGVMGDTQDTTTSPPSSLWFEWVGTGGNLLQLRAGGGTYGNSDENNSVNGTTQNAPPGVKTAAGACVRGYSYAQGGYGYNYINGATGTTPNQAWTDYMRSMPSTAYIGTAVANGRSQYGGPVHRVLAYDFQLSTTAIASLNTALLAGVTS
jgi:hypothetical protein